MKTGNRHSGVFRCACVLLVHGNAFLSGIRAIVVKQLRDDCDKTVEGLFEMDLQAKREGRSVDRESREKTHSDMMQYTIKVRLYLQPDFSGYENQPVLLAVLHEKLLHQVSDEASC